MRIALIIHCTPLYGANRSVLSLIEGLRDHGVSPYVIAPSQGEVTGALRERGVPVAVVPFKWWMSPARPAGNNPIARAWRRMRRRRRIRKHRRRNLQCVPVLRRQLSEWEIDAVYSSSVVVSVGALVAAALRLPHLWHVREFGDLDYGLTPDEGRDEVRRALESAQAIVTVSKAVRAHLLGDGTTSNVTVLPNGVAREADFDRYKALAEAEPTSARAFTFCLPGLLHPAKGQEDALRALACVRERHPNVRLILAGSGEPDEEERLRALASELGVVDGVEFPGYVVDPYEVYLASDALLVCARNEAFGRTTVEAMSACRPVIGYDSAGTSEQIEHERTGLLYRGGPYALAACMTRLLEDPTWARDLGRNGWQVARTKYTIEACARQFYDILRRIVDQSSPATW